MPTDLLPRLLVHTVLGDFAIDPWMRGQIDLSPYGFTGYDVQTNPITGRFEVVLHHALGDVPIDPFATGGEPVDVSRYGITGHEIVWGPPVIDNPIGQNLLMIGLGVAFIAVMWWLGRSR